MPDGAPIPGDPSSNDATADREQLSSAAKDLSAAATTLRQALTDGVVPRKSTEALAARLDGLASRLDQSEDSAEKMPE